MKPEYIGKKLTPGSRYPEIKWVNRRTPGGKSFRELTGIADDGSTAVFSFHYPAEEWSIPEARNHCSQNGALFSAGDDTGGHKCSGLCGGMGKGRKQKVFEYKNFPFEVKDMDERGGFTGMLSTNGNIDPVGDRFVAGTWKRTLKNKKRFPLLKNHDSDFQVGSFKGFDKEEGLYIEAQLNLEKHENGAPMVPLAWEQYSLYKKKDADGLSVGFYTVPSGIKFLDEGGRRIREISEAELIEGSMTPFPMNQLARVTGIKGGWDSIYMEILKNADKQEFKDKLISLLGYDPAIISTLEDETKDQARNDDTTCDLERCDQTMIDMMYEYLKGG